MVELTRLPCISALGSVAILLLRQSTAASETCRGNQRSLRHADCAVIRSILDTAALGIFRRFAPFRDFGFNIVSTAPFPAFGRISMANPDPSRPRRLFARPRFPIETVPYYTVQSKYPSRVLRDYNLTRRDVSFTCSCVVLPIGKNPPQKLIVTGHWRGSTTAHPFYLQN